jgi:hypothetical protein
MFPPLLFKEADLIMPSKKPTINERSNIPVVVMDEEKEKPVTIAEKAADKAVKLLDAELPPAGKLPVIMDNKLTGLLCTKRSGMPLKQTTCCMANRSLRVDWERRLHTKG